MDLQAPCPLQALAPEHFIVAAKVGATGAAALSTSTAAAVAIAVPEIDLDFIACVPFLRKG
jgi:hypothetical protein